MATFPTYAKIKTGFAEELENVIRRTELESGPPKQIKFKSRQLTKQAITVYLESLTDYQNFKSWIQENGHDWFDFNDLVSGNTVQARLVADGIGNPEYTDQYMQFWQWELAIEFYEN